jgi:hypothetical protein
VENPNAERKLKRIVDNGCFQFERPMKTGKKDIETVMIRIPITARTSTHQRVKNCQKEVMSVFYR